MKQYVLFYLVILTVFLSCDPKETDSCHRRILFYNNSDKVIYVGSQDNYPDTTVYRYGSIGNKIEISELNKEALSLRDCYEGRFNGYYHSGILMIFVFDAHVVETASRDSISKKHMVLKRYDLTLQDLQDLNWTINYP